MTRITDFVKSHRPEAVLAVIILVLTTIPLLDMLLVLGTAWPNIPPTFTDETFYDARVQTVVKGNYAGGEPYFLEHRSDPPLVVFVGTWLSAIPQLMGLSLNTSKLLNFILWSLLFAAALYWLFRVLRIPPWVAVFGTVFLYVESYAHVWRTVNLQTVFPIYFLFYVALACFIREQSRRQSVFLGVATGATFYFFAYLWQAAAITLGLLFLYALIRKDRSYVKATLLSSLIGGAIGLPVPLYALWLSHASPYFWESVYRLGLVNTHLPMAEVIYSGGWIGIVLAFLAVLWWRVRAMRSDSEFVFLVRFLAISGLGLWVMQGSNLITGKLLETGEHVRLLIQPWLVLSAISIGVFLWRRRILLSRGLKTLSVLVVIGITGVSAHFAEANIIPFLPTYIDHSVWQTEESYAKPFAWLQAQEGTPVVVWSDPHDNLSQYLPVFTRHFTLYTYFGMLELAPEGEIRERYLVSQYFNNPTLTELESEGEMSLYLGRHDLPHEAMTIARRIKICRILFFWDKNKDCGTIPTPQSLLGDAFFNNLENKFQKDIKPNIKAYLEKYHVSYILKDKVLDPAYHPEVLGAKLVYSDDRYELWHL